MFETCPGRNVARVSKFCSKVSKFTINFVHLSCGQRRLPEQPVPSQRTMYRPRRHVRLRMSRRLRRANVWSHRQPLSPGGAKVSQRSRLYERRPRGDMSMRSRLRRKAVRICHRWMHEVMIFQFAAVLLISIFISVWLFPCIFFSFPDDEWCFQFEWSLTIDLPQTWPTSGSDTILSLLDDHFLCFLCWNYKVKWLTFQGSVLKAGFLQCCQ